MPLLHKPRRQALKRYVGPEERYGRRAQSRAPLITPPPEPVAVQAKQEPAPAPVKTAFQRLMEEDEY